MSEILNFFESFSQASHFMMMVKIAVAFVLGVVIGVERELKHKPVGVKTCTIIAITTCILTIVSIQSAEYYAQMSDNIRTDPMRLAAQVISGIGFLGAGVILRKSNDAISGLTTAAIIWAAAGIGIASGAGFFFDAIMATLMILIAIRLSPLIQLFITKRNNKDRNKRKARLHITMNNTTYIGTLTDALLEKGWRFEQISVKDQPDGQVKVSYRYTELDSDTAQSMFALAKSLPDVVNVQVEN